MCPEILVKITIWQMVHNGFIFHTENSGGIELYMYYLQNTDILFSFSLKEAGWL